MRTSDPWPACTVERHGRPIHRALGLTDDEADRHRAHPRPAAEPPRAGHVRRDVVRALLLQVVARAPRAAADRGAVGARRPGRERRRGRRRRRHRRRHPHREPQPPVGHRAVPGRGHRRRRHPARHLHDGRPAHRAHGPAALRPARRRPQPLDRRGRGLGHLRLRQRGRRADRRRRGRVRRDLPRQPARQRAVPRACCPPTGWCSARPRGVGNLAVLLGSTHRSRRHRRRERAGRRPGFGDEADDAPSGRACRSATRSRRSG